MNKFVFAIKSIAAFAIAFFLTCSASAQTASNGLTKQGNDIRLGGTLTQNTTIDLGSSYFFKLSKSSQDYLTVINGGNIGIGTASPTAQLHTTGSVRFNTLAGTGSRMVVADADGVLSTQAIPGGGGGAPGGSNTHIQYNNNGAFAGETAFAWNSTTKSLDILGAQTIVGQTDKVQLAIKAAAAQTDQSDIFQILTSGGTTMLGIGKHANYTYLDAPFGNGRLWFKQGLGVSSGSGISNLNSGGEVRFESDGGITVRNNGNNITAQFNNAGTLTLPNLATNITAPTTTGTTKMVVTDQNGLLSYQDIPSSSSSLITGNTIYVDKNNPNATDIRTGLSKYSIDKPFQTIQAAVNALSSTGNEVVWVRGGTYYEKVRFYDDGGYSYKNQTLILENSGINSGDTSLNIQTAWGSTVTIKGIGNSFISNNSGDGTPSLYVRTFHDGHTLKIENLTITNTSGVGAVLATTNWGTVLQNVIINKTGGTGYAVMGSNLIFRECNIISNDKGLYSTHAAFYNSNINTNGINVFFDNSVDFQAYYSRFQSKYDANINGGNWGSITIIENSTFQANTYNVSIGYNNTTTMKASLKNNYFFAQSNIENTVSITGLTAGDTTYVTGNYSNGNIFIGGGTYSSSVIVKSNNFKTSFVNNFGDLLYRGADGMITNLPKGTSGQVLTVNTDGSLGWGAGGGSSANTWSLAGNSGTTNSFIGTTDAQPLSLRTNNTERINISSAGNIGIGTTALTGYSLAVNGSGLFTRVKVKEYATWPDYVFDQSYKLPSLKQVEEFIKQHKHLPDVPSAQDVKKEGLDIGDNQAILLKKIEELTLYAIEQNKKQEEQNKRIEQLEKELEALKKK